MMIGAQAAKKHADEQLPSEGRIWWRMASSGALTTARSPSAREVRIRAHLDD